MGDQERRLRNWQRSGRKYTFLGGASLMMFLFCCPFSIGPNGTDLGAILTMISAAGIAWAVVLSLKHEDKRPV